MSVRVLSIHTEDYRSPVLVVDVDVAVVVSFLFACARNARLFSADLGDTGAFRLGHATEKKINTRAEKYIESQRAPESVVTTDQTSRPLNPFLFYLFLIFSIGHILLKYHSKFFLIELIELSI